MRRFVPLLVLFALLAGCPDNTNKDGNEDDCECECEDITTPPPRDSSPPPTNCDPEPSEPQTDYFAAQREVGGEWTGGACGTYDLKINQLDLENGWVYLAYRDDEVGYSGKLPFEGKKSTRAALLFGDHFVGVRECSSQSCTVVCQEIFD